MYKPKHKYELIDLLLISYPNDKSKFIKMKKNQLYAIYYKLHNKVKTELKELPFEDRYNTRQCLICKVWEYEDKLAWENNNYYCLNCLLKECKKMEQEDREEIIDWLELKKEISRLEKLLKSVKLEFGNQEHITAVKELKRLKELASEN